MSLNSQFSSISHFGFFRLQWEEGEEKEDGWFVGILPGPVLGAPSMETHLTHLLPCEVCIFQKQGIWDSKRISHLPKTWPFEPGPDTQTFAITQHPQTIHIYNHSHGQWETPKVQSTGRWDKFQIPSSAVQRLWGFRLNNLLDDSWSPLCLFLSHLPAPQAWAEDA